MKETIKKTIAEIKKGIVNERVKKYFKCNSHTFSEDKVIIQYECKDGIYAEFDITDLLEDL